MELFILGSFSSTNQTELDLNSKIKCLACTESKIYVVGSSGSICYCDKESSNLSLISFAFPQACLMISCGSSHCGLITDTYNSYTWGSNTHGALGVGSSIQYSKSPIPILPNVSGISCGGFHTFFIVSGQAYSCGKGSEGQLGLETSNSFTPTLLEFPETISEVSCGLNHTGIISTNGYLYATGDNRFGQLGVGHTQNTSKFQRVKLEKVECISFGHHSAAVSHGKLYLWGTGTFGKYFSPKLIGVTQRIVRISVGECSGCALDENGGVWGWGSNNYGQLGPGDEIVKPTRIVEAFSGNYIAMAQKFCAVVGEKIGGTRKEEIETEKLLRENREMSEIIEEFKKRNIEAENILRESQNSCQYYREIALRVEDLERSEGKVLEQLEEIRNDNKKLFNSNDKLRQENCQLINAKSLLEDEVERLNNIIFQMENKIVELMSENEKIVNNMGDMMAPKSTRQETIHKYPLKNRQEKEERGGFYNTEPIDRRDWKSNTTFTSGKYGARKTCEDLGLGFSSANSSLNESYDAKTSPEQRRKLSDVHKNKLRRKASENLTTKNPNIHFTFSSPLPSPKSIKKEENDKIKMITRNRYKIETGQSIEQIKKMIKVIQENKHNLMKT